MEQNDELIKALLSLGSALEKAGFTRSDAGQPATVKQPDRFEHTDVDGDRVEVYPHGYPHVQSLLMVKTGGCGAVRLSQDAVNRLAQYLDRYRTDRADADMIWKPREHWCGKSVNHGEHVHARDSEAMYCLGSHEGVYGAKP